MLKFVVVGDLKVHYIHILRQYMKKFKNKEVQASNLEDDVRELTTTNKAKLKYWLL
jgi:hypothetical protein